MSNVANVKSRLKTLDVTRLKQYTNKINDIANLNPLMASTYLRDFIMAYDLTNSMLMVAIKADLDASSELDKSKSIAFLDKASAYLKTNGLKDSNGAREMYINLDPDVIIAKDLKAQTAALVQFFKNKLFSFRYAHDDVKKIAYTDERKTAYEGMS